VNGVEWVGRKLSVGGQATGTILAAFGTALPESAVTFVAVVFGETAEQREIGVGAALGGPLVLATVAYAVVGLTLILCRARLLQTEAVRRDFRNLSRDQGWFLGPCHIAERGTRKTFVPLILRRLRPPHATCPSPRRESLGASTLKSDGAEC
jgi:hypothetical protein